MLENKGGMSYSVSINLIYSSLFAVLSNRSLKAARKSKLDRISVGFNIVEEIYEDHQYRWEEKWTLCWWHWSPRKDSWVKKNMQLEFYLECILRVVFRKLNLEIIYLFFCSKNSKEFSWRKIPKPDQECLTIAGRPKCLYLLILTTFPDRSLLTLVIISPCVRPA